MKQPLVTVVIPTFNRGWVIQKAVDSVLAQDYGNIQLIVVNDGSTDNTGSILSHYGERITVINQPNMGVSAARNTGIKNAGGAFVAFLDSDDSWLPSKLSAQITFFNENPDADICQCEEIWIRKGKRVNPRFKHKKPSGMIFEQSLHLCLVSPSAVIIKKSLFQEKGLFDETLPACEDYDLWLRISCTKPVYLTANADVVKTGGHDDQLSSMPGLDKFRIQSIKNLLESNVLDSVQYQAALAVMQTKCQIYSDGCLKRGKIEEARYYASLCLPFSPSPK
jgi:glycosyltransferase involved in cell wall biosynthesis